MEFSHIDKEGKVKMVDISGKEVVKRTARASSTVRMAPETAAMLKDKLLKKGDAAAAAKLAGIAGAKRTWELIPLCHNIPIDTVDVSVDIREDSVRITAEAVCTWKTGIEMEALTAVSVAALTIYDMCKAVDKNKEITGIKLLEKKKEKIQ